MTNERVRSGLSKVDSCYDLQKTILELIGFKVNITLRSSLISEELTIYIINMVSTTLWPDDEKSNLS